MAWRTVTERLRATLIRAFKVNEGWGSVTRLEEFSRERHKHSPYRPVTVPQMSMFLRGHRGLTLDFLDDVAAFLNRSVGELFSPIRAGDLQGAEHRMLLAFRAIPESAQQHMLAILELTALSIYAVEKRDRKSRPRRIVQEKAPGPAGISKETVGGPGTAIEHDHEHSTSHGPSPAVLASPEEAETIRLAHQELAHLQQRAARADRHLAAGHKPPPKTRARKTRGSRGRD